MKNHRQDIDLLIAGYRKDWTTIQREIAASKYADFFQTWYPDLFNRTQPLTIKELWQLMDVAWDEMHVRSEKDLMRYYTHPIWWLNAKIEETHDISIRHRLLAVLLATQMNPRLALDRGGGYGLTTRIAHDLLPNTEIHLDDVVDSSATEDLLVDYPRIHHIDTPRPPYDVIWSIEVFEHLPDPFGEVRYLNSLLRNGGVLITSYSFYPMIKCHLPRNHYLHSVFHRIIQLMGFRLIEYRRQAETVWVFQKVRPCGSITLNTVRMTFRIVKPLIIIANSTYPHFKNLIRRCLKAITH